MSSTPRRAGKNPMDLVTRVSPNQQLIRRVVWQSEQCSESYSLVKNIKKKGKCSSNLYNTEQILMTIQFYFKEGDYSIYIHLQQAQAHWKIPIFEQKEMYWWTELLLPSRRNNVQRNRKKKSISLIALQLHIVFLSCLYRQIIVLSFLLWTVPLKHLWNGGCVWLVKGCDPGDKSVHLPEQVPAVLLWYRSAPEHMGSESTLYYLEDFLLPLQFSWGQSRLLKWLTYPRDLSFKRFHGTCRRSTNFTEMNRLLRKV